MDAEILKFIGMILGPTGAAWYGVKASVNGMREDVREIKKRVTAIDGRVQSNRVELASMKERVATGEHRLDRLEKP